MTSNITEKTNLLQTIKSGLVSGSTAAIVTQPLEVIKTEILVNPLRNSVIETSGPLKSMVISSQRIWSFEKGGIRNFYRGAIIAGIRQSIGFSTYVCLLKEINYATQASQSEWKYLIYSANAAMAKSLAVTLTTPLIVLKTRMEVLSGAKSSIFATLQQVWKKESLAGLYRGASSLLSREIVFSFIHYGAYEYLKDKMEVKGTTAIHQNIIAAVTASTLANVCSHPFEVIRNRVQVESKFLEAHKRYSNVFEGLLKIYKNEGFRGYIKGIGPRFMKKPLNNAINWVLFDILSEKRNNK